MQNDYDELYIQFEKNFKEEASTLISEEKIQLTLKEEKIRFKNAQKNNINPKKLTGSNPTRYIKDVLRRSQPLFFVYYLLSMFTEFFYCLLLWDIVKCIYLYLTGTRNAFTAKIPLALSLVFIAVTIICNTITQLYIRKVLYKPTKNIATSISIFNTAAYLLSAIIIVLSAFFIYSGIFKYPVLNVTLLEVFLATVAVLFLSGIHNVIYSSHISAFIAIGQAIVLRKADETKKAINHYKALTLTNFLTSRHINNGSNTTDESSLSEELKFDFKQSLRSKIISIRVYCAIGFFIMIILSGMCIWQLLISGISIGFILFTIAAVAISAVFLLSVLSCNTVLKSL